MRAFLMLLIMVAVPLGLVAYAVLQFSQGAPASPSPGAGSSPSSGSISPQPRPSASPAGLPATLSQGTDLNPETAQAIVRSWFDAISAADYERAEALATGTAATKTQSAIDQITQQAGQRGVTVTAAVQRLDLTMTSGAPQDGQAVRAAFDIAVKAGVGPVSVDAGQVQGGATFIVQKVSEGIRITDITDATGLTGSS